MIQQLKQGFLYYLFATALTGGLLMWYIKGDTVGDILLYGQGAGKLPTASAVAGDVIEAAAHPAPLPAPLPFATAADADYADAEAVPSPF